MSPKVRTGTVAALVAASAVSLALTATPAAALIREVDSYCSVSGDFCSGVYRRSNGIILFQVGGFGNYFGTLSICVTKETTACRTVDPRQIDEYFYEWKMRWQRSFPFEGFGLYRVRMTGEYWDSHWLGGRDYRFWYTRRNAAPEHRPTPTPSPSPTASPSPSASPTP